MDRRQFAKHSLAAIAGLGTGYTVVQETTDKGAASAAISMGDLSIDDASKETRDGTIKTVKVDLDGNWQYDIPAGKDPHHWRVELSATNGENVEKVGQDTGEARYLKSSGSYSITGDLTDTEIYSAEDFSAPEGKVKTVTIGFALRFMLDSGDNDRLAQTTIEDTAKVEVTHLGYQPTEHGEASGSGSLRIVDD
jgi:hypothetical protein